LLKSRKRSSTTNRKQSDYDFLDSTQSKTNDQDLSVLNIDTFDEIDGDNDEEKKAKLLEKRLQEEKNEFKKSLLGDKSVYFNARVCKLLTEYLTSFQLAGLTAIDQIHLVALADTVANVKCDVNFGQEDLFKKTEFLDNNNSSDASNENVTVSQIVDNCGLKFLLAVRSYNYLMRTLPETNRERLKEVGVGTANFAWAFHSECEQELLNSILKVNNTNEKITWSELRQYGVGWWLKSPTVLKQLAEQIAKYSFQSNNDPLDAALFYLAMKKKGVLWGLFKTIKDTKMADFFKNDFNESKWQTAALKNAFVLLGKQRFEHAAAFFLLAGRLKDAVEVCLRNLHDLQLAMVIVRLYETNFDELTSHLNKILSTEVLGFSLVNDQLNGKAFGTLSQHIDYNKASKDPFLRSMANWFNKDYKQSLYTLYEIDNNNSNEETMNISSNIKSHFSGISDNKRDDSMISHVFNFYTFLKYHPLILKLISIEDNSSDSKSGINQVVNKKTEFKLTITPIERRLHFVAGYYHLVNGCPLLTLDVLSKLPKYITKDFDSSNKKETSKNDEAFKDVPDFSSNPIKKEEKADQFDWGATNFEAMSFKNRFDDELELDLKLDSDSDSDSDTESKKIIEENVPKSVETENIVAKKEIDNKLPIQDEENNLNDINGEVDTFAQQIKFISCLKILIEEMSTLATGFEVVGGQLRLIFF
jgi:DmX-like protein